MSLRMLLVLPLAAVALALPLDAQQRPADARTPLLSGQVGVAVMSAPRYPGSDERWLLPLPLVNLRVAGRVLLGGSASGLGGGGAVLLAESRSVSWTADLSLTADRPEDRADALAGLGDRGLGVYAGSSLTWRRGIVALTASAARGLEDRMGTVGSLGATLSPRLHRRWITQLGAGVVVADDEAMDWDFEIVNATPRLGTYDPAGGLREVTGSATVGYVLTRRLALVGVASVTRLTDEAARSPLVAQRTTWTVISALAWTL